MMHVVYKLGEGEREKNIGKLPFQQHPENRYA